MNGITAATPLVTTPDSRRALRLVVLLGIVSLFADMTYEGARSIAGPFLAVLGASGTVVGLVAGLGELAGYALRCGRAGWPIGRTATGRSRSRAMP